MGLTNGAAAGAMNGATVSTVSALFFGAPPDALIMGMVAAVLASFWMTSINNRVKSFAAIVLSSLLAGYAAPVAAVYLATHYPALADADDQTLRVLLALVVGLSAPLLVPAAVQGARKILARGKTGETP
ncbi:MAG: hypothetical protein LBU43_13100 [Candidatus Accumulibacter sp.]|jgi:hypothetical protein|nr:hypothetical protein [Accumulibacter sp.]